MENGLNIYNINTDIVDRFIDSPFKHDFGIASRSHIMGYGGGLVVAVMDVDSEWDNLNQQQRNDRFDNIVKIFANKIGAFCDCLWFVKDNSTTTHNVFAQFEHLDKNGHSMYLRKGASTMSGGEYATTIFSSVEMTRAINVLKSLVTILNPNDSVRNQIDKAYRFLLAARNADYLPAKIAMYMSSLESLFSTNPGDLTFKISSRVACYIGTTKEEKENIFDTVKDAYDIRSTYLHGGEHKQKKKGSKDFQAELSQKIDEITRKVFNKVIMHDSAMFLQSKDDHEKFLKNLIF